MEGITDVDKYNYAVEKNINDYLNGKPYIYFTNNEPQLMHNDIPKPTVDTSIITPVVVLSKSQINAPPYYGPSIENTNING
jgi:hypothetical protein